MPLNILVPVNVLFPLVFTYPAKSDKFAFSFSAELTAEKLLSVSVWNVDRVVLVVAILL